MGPLASIEYTKFQNAWLFSIRPSEIIHPKQTGKFGNACLTLSTVSMRLHSEDRMSGVKVKICGITDVNTAIQTQNLGADWIGLNFSPRSKRNISIKSAKEISSALHEKGHKTQVVLLFFRNEMDYIREVISEVKHDWIQIIAGDPVAREVMNSYPQEKILFSLPVKGPIHNQDVQAAPGILKILDAYSPGEGGGTGHKFPWEWVRGIQERYLLAGGLTPENVASAVRELKPYGVDVASGVETDGKKDILKIKEFLKNAKGK